MGLDDSQSHTTVNNAILGWLFENCSNLAEKYRLKFGKFYSFCTMPTWTLIHLSKFLDVCFVKVCPLFERPKSKVLKILWNIYEFYWILPASIWNSRIVLVSRMHAASKLHKIMMMIAETYRNFVHFTMTCIYPCMHVRSE